MTYPLVDRGYFPPGTCLITGDPEGPFFDFGDRSPAGSRVYVGSDVIESCGRVLGMLPKGEADAMRNRAAQAEQTIAQLEAKAAAWDAYSGKETASA